jgi:hypothetical protein
MKMALERKSLIGLAKATAKASVNPSLTFSYGEEKLSGKALESAFRAELKELAATPALYRRNKDTIFELMEIQLTEVLPPRVLAEYGQFADVRTFAQGDQAVFYQKITEASRRRAKQFVTKVGLAGRYEVFKLDGATLTVPVTAYGGAAQIAFEEFLDGRVTMSDVYDIVLEGMDDAVYKEIAAALKAYVDAMMTANATTAGTYVNVVTASGFDEAAMDKLLMIADTYGKSAIYCTFEFAATMIPQTGWISDNMRDRRWNMGYLGDYKGHQVIVLPQSFEDETNKVKVIDPAYAYIIPTGSEKPVKVAFEGSAQVKEVDGDDWSKTIHTYQKFGVAVYGVNPGFCAYKNQTLTVNM